MSLLVQFIHLNTLGSKENGCMIEFCHSLNRLLGMLKVGIFLHFKQLGRYSLQFFKGWVNEYYLILFFKESSNVLET